MAQVNLALNRLLDDKGELPMHQREMAIKQNIEETRAEMDKKIGMIENRVHGTVEQARLTVDTVVDKVKHVQETVQEAKSKVDNIIEAVSIAMNETVERATYTTHLIKEVNKNPWIALGGAILFGYILGSVNQRKSLIPSSYIERSGEKSHIPGRHREQIGVYSGAGTMVTPPPSA
jgi:hypothetical protein